MLSRFRCRLTLYRNSDRKSCPPPPPKKNTISVQQQFFVCIQLKASRVDSLQNNSRVLVGTANGFSYLCQLQCDAENILHFSEKVVCNTCYCMFVEETCVVLVSGAARVWISKLFVLQLCNLLPFCVQLNVHFGASNHEPTDFEFFFCDI